MLFFQNKVKSNSEERILEEIKHRKISFLCLIITTWFCFLGGVINFFLNFLYLHIGFNQIIIRYGIICLHCLVEVLSTTLISCIIQDYRCLYIIHLWNAVYSFLNWAHIFVQQGTGNVYLNTIVMVVWFMDTAWNLCKMVYFLYKNVRFCKQHAIEKKYVKQKQNEYKNQQQQPKIVLPSPSTSEIEVDVDVNKDLNAIGEKDLEISLEIVDVNDKPYHSSIVIGDAPCSL